MIEFHEFSKSLLTGEFGEMFKHAFGVDFNPQLWAELKWPVPSEVGVVFDGNEKAWFFVIWNEGETAVLTGIGRLKESTTEEQTRYLVQIMGAIYNKGFKKIAYRTPTDDRTHIAACLYHGFYLVGVHEAGGVLFAHLFHNREDLAGSGSLH